MGRQLEFETIRHRRTVSRMAGSYLILTSGVLFLYMISPVVSYLIFWKLLPVFSLTMVFGIFLVFMIFFRILLLLTNQLTLHSKGFASVMILLLWISLLQFLWFPRILAQLSSKDVFATLSFTIVGTLVTFLGGEALAYLVIYRPRLARMGILAAYVSLALVVVDGVLRGFKCYGLFLFAFQDPVSREVYNYLALGDSLALLGILLLGMREGSGFYGRLVLYFSSAILLLLSYSRTSFFLFLLVGFAVFFSWSRAELRRRSLGLLIRVGVLSGAILMILQGGVLKSGDILERADITINRISSLFSGEDLSFQMRLELLKQGIELLKEHWLFGHFMIEALETGRGTYIHNWLSFWLAYGIGPFLLSVWVMFSLLAKSWRMRKYSSLGLMAFGLLGFSLLAIALSRSYIWPYIWFALGFTGTALSFHLRRRTA